MATDWNGLRPMNGSREKGFEEICCQIAAGESYPAGSKFIRKGMPDAGVECLWTLPGGDEHAWQAKFFTSPPTPGQWKQIDDSVKTALAKHPRLTRYTVCLPIDRPDARVKGQNGFLDKWDKNVTNWKEWAAGRRMAVEFEFWGDHELTSRLTRDENRGRHWFWFSRDQFTLEWFRNKLSIAIENAGERYTPVLNVDLPIAKSFSALGQTQRFHDSLNAAYQRIRESAGQFALAKLPAGVKEQAKKAQEAVRALGDLFDAILTPFHDPAVAPFPDPIPWGDLKQLAQPLHDLLDQTSSLLWSQILERPPQDQQPLPGAACLSARELQNTAYYCRDFQHAISALIDFCGGIEASVCNRPALLLVGEAGQGKTHLLCDIAAKDLKENRPRILLHGAHFKDAEPWSQIVQFLGLNCSTDEFIGALEAAGRAYGCRLLILIDALNEGDGRELWKKHLAGMLGVLAGNPWLGIAVSVRSSYEELVVPDGLIDSRLTKVIHPGFEEHEYEAVNRFFVHYGIQPTTPLLMPEFTNPLFLKLFCKGVKENGWTRVPLGLRGITAILDMLLDATNRKLSDPKRMDYDRASNPVKKAIDVLVRLMAKSGKRWVPRAQAVQAVNQIYKVDGYDRSLFRNLVAEGILAESRWSTQEGNIEIVSFVYERFGDHLLARHFIDTSLDRKALKRSFDPRTKLGKLLKTEADSYQHVGLIEALSVQIPEIIRRELFEIAPHASKFDIVDEAFLKSLVWRASNAFTKATFNRANDLIQDNSASGDILNAALTVAPVPDHPLNANKLHRVLLRLKMADRDAWWSIFLHSEWRGGRAVSRLIDWTLGESNKSDLEEPVVLLTGTAISWFLTSSNRFLRDRATKALVKLFENRLATLQVLLDRFWTVNDPYVLERLLAASYGCVMRSQDKSGLTELAADVSKHMFQKMKVLPQLLTRDYARGIIDCARQWGVVPADAFPESQPPYGSKWPNMKMPDSQSLAKWGEWRKGEPDADWAQREVYSSVMGNGLSDFSHYVIGDLHEWTSVRLGVKPPQTVKEQFDEFVTNLRPVQRKALDQFRIVSDNVRLCRRLSPEEQKEHFEGPFTDDQLNVVLADAEKRIITLLKGTPASKRVFETVAKPYIDDPHQYRLPYTFDGTVARRWMVQRIIDYGWTTKRFGEFDRMVNRWSYSGREASKPERIGKKYQWIAYHELLARLSDNFYMRKDAFSDHGLREYSGPWDSRCGSARDIDPSIVVRSTPTDDELAGRAWWSPIAYSGWRAPVEDADWLRDTNDLPAVETLLSVRSPHDDSQWFVLDTHVEWKQPAKPGHKNYELPQRDLWCIIGSYLVRRADAATFFRWAKRQDFMGRWMPESVGVYHIFFGEYFWAPAYREIINEYQTDGWTRGSFDRVPTDVLVTSLDFVNESSGFDCSIDASLQIKIPAPAIANGMQLRWSGSEGRYIDPAGRLAAFDPSVFEPGPGALLVRQDALKRYLADNGLELFWTLLGEKRLIGGNSRSEFGWLELSGIYRLTGDGIVGKLSAEHEIGPRPQRRSRRKK